MTLDYKFKPIRAQFGAVSEMRQFMAQFVLRMPELHHYLFFAENNSINLRKNCGE